MPGPLDFMQGATGAMAGPTAAPMSIADLIARIMQSQQTPPPPKDQSQLMPGGMSDIAKNILSPGMSVAKNVFPMPPPTPVPTTTIPSPQVSTQAVPPTPANPMLPPVARGPQMTLPPQQQNYYNLLSGGFGSSPYRIPG